MNLLILLFTIFTLPLATPENIHGFNVLNHNTFEILNPHRQNSALKFSLTGINITNIRYTSIIEEWILSIANFNEKIKIYKSYEQKRVKSEFLFHWDMDVEDLDDLPDQVEVCFHYGHNNASWYSTYEEREQHWPMSTAKSIPNPIQFTTGEYFHTQFGSVLEYLFLTSDGFALMLSDHEPFQLRRDPNTADPLLCVSLEKRFKFSFKFEILAASDIKAAWQNITSGHTYVKWAKPKSIPDERLFKEPIWSTWVQYKRAVNQSDVLELAKQIKSRAFTCSNIEIDDKWEAQYGDLTFDRTKFPDAKKMIEEIHKLGCRVSVWVHPFVSIESAAYNTSAQYLAKDKNGGLVHAKWWNDKNGTSSRIIDFSNDHASLWFIGRLTKLKIETGIDTFKFDAGELEWYGPKVHFDDSWTRRHPDLVAQSYAEMAAKLGAAVEVRVGYKSQNLPIFVRMLDRASNWEVNNGLKSLLPAALTMSIAGYPFILPDMIGGNGKPSEELFIRWVQANTFLPAMQFSIVPWTFNDSTVKIVKKFIDLHAEHAPTIVALAKNCSTGQLLLRPMWYAEPNDAKSCSISDQFMVGENLLVAPVVVEGGREREVYLPTGTWIDQHGKTFKGPGVVKVKAPLEELPYFKRSEK